MKRLGKEKAAELAEKAPGITLSDWLEKNYLHVSLDSIISQGGKRLAIPQANVELTIALLSTDNVADWAKVAFHFCPPGTIIDKIPLNYYESKVLLLRQVLTKKLVLDHDNKLAQRYLQILERRDSERWAAKKQAMSLKATATTGNEAGDDSKKVRFEFEIVDPS